VFEALSGPRTLALAEPGRNFLFDDDAFDEDYDAIDEFAGDDRAGAALADQIIRLLGPQPEILRLLGPQPVELDEIARQCGASPAEFSLAVLELNLAGRIDLLPGGMIVIVDPGA
jgi:predicted Rossmann fold nucleotide-binding protein DprA/Smf involved in DNA uptake